ncbi:hypothetical protein EBR66_00380 [bacterium]|nr:hypothetical protein [bacterium]
MAVHNVHANALTEALAKLGPDTLCCVLFVQNGGYLTLKLILSGNEIECVFFLIPNEVMGIVAGWTEKYNRRNVPMFQEFSNPEGSEHSRRWSLVSARTLQEICPEKAIHFTPI